MTDTQKVKPFTAEIRRHPQMTQAAVQDAGMPGAVDILNAIESLRQDLGLRNSEAAPTDLPQAPISGIDPEQQASVREQLAELQRAIDLTKTELASLRLKGTPPARLEDVGNELDAVVTATEGATNEILTSAEQVNALVHNLRSQGAADQDAPELTEIEDQMLRVFEACNFQDITGQRITKVVNTMKLVETTLDQILKRFGGIDSELIEKVATAAGEKADSEKDLLNGPALEADVKVSQDDIDALFS